MIYGVIRLHGEKVRRLRGYTVKRLEGLGGLGVQRSRRPEAWASRPSPDLLDHSTLLNHANPGENRGVSGGNVRNVPE